MSYEPYDGEGPSERKPKTSATLFASGKARGKGQEVSCVPCERVRCLRRVASHRSS